MPIPSSVLCLGYGTERLVRRLSEVGVGPKLPDSLATWVPGPRPHCLLGSGLCCKFPRSLKDGKRLR